MSFGPWRSLECMQAWRQQPEFKTTLVKLKKMCDEIKLSTMKSVLNIPQDTMRCKMDDVICQKKNKSYKEGSCPQIIDFILYNFGLPFVP